MRYLLALVLLSSSLQSSDFALVAQDSREWKNIQDLSVTLSPPFLFGVSTATWQDSGAVNCPHSQWSHWETLTVDEDNRSGQSANLYKLYQTPQGRQEVISRLNKLHVSSYRFSIEWSHIEPTQGAFHQEMLEPYIHLCKDLSNSGITPMVTLHHFSEPQWFHEMGSFEKEENIEHFLSFVSKIYPQLVQEYNNKPLVPYICTINEPGVEAFSRYIRGAFSPGVKLSFTRAAEFLHNALKAHARAYEMCKPLNPNVQIGIVHQRLAFIPTNFLIAPVTNTLTQFINETPLTYLNSGTFDFQIPLVCHVHYDDAKPQADFLGLQYYTRPVIGFSGSTSYHEPMTQMPFREDPEGLFEAIIDTYQKCPLPLIITENGISTHDEKQRARYLERALYATMLARNVIGEKNLQGYYLWSFCKNAEWDMGMAPQNFGAYAIDDNGNLCQEPHPGTKPFVDAAKKLR